VVVGFIALDLFGLKACPGGPQIRPQERRGHRPERPRDARHPVGAALVATGLVEEPAALGRQLLSFGLADQLAPRV
jgi:hypothetical protein